MASVNVDVMAIMMMISETSRPQLWNVMLSRKASGRGA
jgi:hypothetical protein